MLRAPDTCTAFGVLALDEDARHGAKLAKAPTDQQFFTMGFEPFLVVFCCVWPYVNAAARVCATRARREGCGSSHTSPPDAGAPTI